MAGRGSAVTAPPSRLDECQWKGVLSTVHSVSTEALPDAVAALIAAQVDYAAVQATATLSDFTGPLVEALARHGLPIQPGDLGLDIEEFVQAVQYAPQTRPGRYTILEHLDLSENDIRDAVKDYANTYTR